MVLKYITLKNNISAGSTNAKVDEYVVEKGRTVTVKEIRLFSSVTNEEIEVIFVVNREEIGKVDVRNYNVEKLPLPANVELKESDKFTVVATHKGATNTTISVLLIVDEKVGR